MSPGFDKGRRDLAKNTGGENAHARATEAVEAKLGEQRRFVLWWDGQEKNPGNRGAGRGNIRPSQTSDALKAEDYGLDRDTIHRWRKWLKSRADIFFAPLCRITKKRPGGHESTARQVA